MKILTILTIVVLLLSSCRLVNKNISKTKETVASNTDVTTVATQTTAGTSTVIATRTIVEEIDTNQVVKGSTITATGTTSELDAGGIIKTETGDQIIEVRKDPKTGLLIATGKVKDRKIPVKGKKTTLENMATITNTNSGLKSETKLHAEVIKSSSNSDTKISKQPTANYFAIGMCVAFFLVLLILIFIWYRSHSEKNKKQLMP